MDVCQVPAIRRGTSRVERLIVLDVMSLEFRAFPRESPPVLQFEFTRIGPAVGCKKKARPSKLRVWLPISTWDRQPISIRDPPRAMRFKMPLLKRPEISNPDTATCRGGGQSTSGGTEGLPRRIAQHQLPMSADGEGN